MDTASLPRPISHLLMRLHVLSTIRIGWKLNTREWTFTDAASWIGSIQRYVEGENRADMIRCLAILVDDIATTWKTYPACKGMILELVPAVKQGILNLAATYAASPPTVAELHLVIQNLELAISDPIVIPLGR